MDFLVHSKLMQSLQECADGIPESLPRQIDDVFCSVLRKLPTSKVLDWRAISHVAATKSLRPELFSGLSDEQLRTFQELLDYYMFPTDWVLWVHQELAARVADVGVLTDDPHLCALVLNAVDRVVAAVLPIGDVTAALWPMMTVPIGPFDNSFEYIVKVLVGHRDTCKYPRWPWRNIRTFVNIMVRAGDVEGLDWLTVMNGDGGPSPYHCCIAAAEGHLECLKWLRSRGHPWGSTARAAEQNGRLDCLQWAISNGCPIHKCVSCKSSDILISTTTRHVICGSCGFTETVHNGNQSYLQLRA